MYSDIRVVSIHLISIISINGFLRVIYQICLKYVVPLISCQTFFVQAFKIVVDSWKFSMLLLYILWNDWPILMISGSNEQLQQQLEYTLLKPDCHSWWTYWIILVYIFNYRFFSRNVCICFPMWKFIFLNIIKLFRSSWLLYLLISVILSGIHYLS